MDVRFDGQVAIVTGAGNGLGRSHALALAARGAKVVVNDLGGARDGSGASSEAAREVVATIEANGGEAMAHGANVAVMAEVEDMVRQAMDKWGRVDILVNNALLDASSKRVWCLQVHVIKLVKNDHFSTLSLPISKFFIVE